MSVDDSRLSNRTAVTSRTKHVAAPAPGGRGQGSRKNSVTRCFSVTSSNNNTGTNGFVTCEVLPVDSAFKILCTKKIDLEFLHMVHTRY